MLSVDSISYKAIAQYVGAHPNFECQSDGVKLQFYALYKTITGKAPDYSLVYRAYIYVFDHGAYRKWLVWWLASERYSQSEAKAQYFQLAKEIDAFPPNSLMSQMTSDTTGSGISKMLLVAQDSSILLDSGMDRMIEACASNQVDVIQQFIRDGGDVNIKNEEGTTLLHFAVDHGAMDIVQTLVQYGADVNTADDENIMPLDAAILNDFDDIARYLAANGARPSIAE